MGLASALAGNEVLLEVVHTLDPIDPVDVTGIQMRMIEDISFAELDGLLARFNQGMFEQNFI